MLANRFTNLNLYTAYPSSPPDDFPPRPSWARLICLWPASPSNAITWSSCWAEGANHETRVELVVEGQVVLMGKEFIDKHRGSGAGKKHRCGL